MSILAEYQSGNLLILCFLPPSISCKPHVKHHSYRDIGMMYHSTYSIGSRAQNPPLPLFPRNTSAAILQPHLSTWPVRCTILPDTLVTFKLSSNLLPKLLRPSGNGVHAADCLANSSGKYYPHFTPIALRSGPHCCCSTPKIKIPQVMQSSE